MKMKMKMKMIPLGISLFFLAGVTTAIEAPKTIATISDVQGSVLIEHGDKRMPAESGMSLQEGDTVFVLEEATIDLAYAGCNSTLEQNTLLTINEATPCATGDVIGVGLVELTAIQNAAIQNAYTTAVNAGATAAQAASAAAQAGISAGVASGAAISEAVAATMVSAGVAPAAASAAISAAGSMTAAAASSAAALGGVAATTATVAGISGITIGVAAAATATVAVVAENASDSTASPS